MMTSSKSANVMARFLALKPAHVEAHCKTGSELMAWQQEEGLKASRLVADQNRQARIEKILGRSGIQPLHRDCGFKNYLAETEDQQQALALAKSYLRDFGNTHGGFVFSGNVGTGKNHLATAIVRSLITKNKAAAIITVAELCQKFRSTFDKSSPLKEADLMRDICRLDLLVLDEVGVQKTANNDFEINLLSQIIDRRQLQLKPTGMLTNLNHSEMFALLGDRIMDRQTNGGMWVPFTWNSFRSRKGGRA
ncbi:ATP-binding protein [Rouxiella sp. WC2420]|uniref:ATP-binding protein n=1 Tax=Rouxiella sp. WC2420 TaxID=3234145 RepID=A0AB39VN72_9GAMM